MKRIVSALGKLIRPGRACTVFLLGATTVIALSAQTFTTLLSFDFRDGSSPDAPLVQGVDGNLYGTTSSGGIDGGTVFTITPSGALTTLYEFCFLGACPNGGYPAAPLALAAAGAFYGTTERNGGYDQGTVFKITPGGALTTLYSFCAQGECTDGAEPAAGLVQAADGNLYGTTFLGGANYAGTVFKITPSGALTSIHSFGSKESDGKFPYAGLVQAGDGDLYGTTWGGGANSVGTVFRITPSGALTTIHSFGSQPDDGQYPYAGLVEASDGSLYGTTFGGGAYAGGTVFKITPGGALTTLFSFDSGGGGAPVAGLVLGTDGNFYGPTGYFGSNQGTVFQITPGGTLTTLHTFCLESGCPDGADPLGGLVQATNGQFYGTTSTGGAASNCTTCGTIFSLSVGLGPFVKTLPHSGRVGQIVRILGTALTGATAVTLNGIPATFTFYSASEITATVPAGATTGTVEVTTPSGTLLSAGPFTVLP